MKTKEQDGQVLVLVALSMVALMAIVGLAIDGGIAYGVKAKLSSAEDAAAIAAADATGDSSGGYAAAIAAGTARFYANFPAGYLKSTPSAPTITVQPDTPKAGEIQVTVTASATAPTYFMQVLGLNQVSATSTAQTVKSTLDMVLVIDNTGSLAPVGSSVISAAQSFIDKFNPTTDRIGLVNFAEGSNVAVPIYTVARGFDKSAIDSAISSMNFTGSTNYSAAFYQARAQLDSIPVSSQSSRRVIVFFSDGSPNSFSSTFTWGSAQQTGVICSQDPPIYAFPPPYPFGLYRTDVLNSMLQGYNAYQIYPYVTTLPQYFNLGAGIGDGTYHVAPNPPPGTGMAGRPVIASYLGDSNKGFEDVNNAARNLPEEMANNARAAGIYVFTLGYGPDLTVAKNWGNLETGNAVLMNMANDTSAPNHGSDQLTGAYVYAADATEMQGAFEEIASQMLRLTR
ncbi:MAG: vWA domain-containing protein [Nitrospirota bacterium]